ncbi:MAG: hypothetical protein L6455_13295 [Kiritimatiellae bacterium]|nr:hypothetical protein [Kiritimatiellia bacterium]
MSGERRGVKRRPFFWCILRLLAVAACAVSVSGASAKAASVGIMHGLGDEEIKRVLAVKGHNAAIMADLPPADAILQYDCLILPGQVGLGRLTAEKRLRVMEYVARGFGVMLTFDACGFRTWYDDFRPPFPEVESPVGKTATMIAVVAGRHPVVRGLPETFRYGPIGWDAIVMAPGPKGEVVLRNRDGHPIGVVGEVGKGRVAAFGPLIGGDPLGAGAEGPMARLIFNTVEWLATAEKRDEGAPFAVRAEIKAQMEREARQLAQGYRLEDAYCPLEVDCDFAGFDAARIRDAASRKEMLARVEAVAGKLNQGRTDLQEKIRKGMADTELDKALGLMKNGNDTALTGVKDAMAGLDREPFPRPQKTRPPPTLDGCLQALKGAGVEARRQAALDVGRMGDKNAIIGMLDILKDGTADEELVRNIIYACGWNKVIEAVDVLVKVAEGKNVFLRRRAIQALGQIGDSKALTAVIAAQKDGDIEVRKNALYAENWLRSGFHIPVVERSADYDYDWYKHDFTRVQQFHYVNAIRPWPWDRLIRYAAEVDTTLAFSNDPDPNNSLPLFDKYHLRATFFRAGDNEGTILDTLSTVGKYPCAVVMHYDEPGGSEVDRLRELAEFTRGLRKDLIFSTVLQKNFANKPSMDNFAKAAPAVDIVMVDPYDGGAMEEAFLCDLQRSCARGVNWVTLSGFVPDPGQSAQDLAIAYAHTQGIWPFVWQYYFKQPIPPNGVGENMQKVWRVGEGSRWKALVANYRKMAKIEPYLAQARPCAQVAFIFSERTGNLYSPPNIGRPGRYFQNQAGIYHALVQQHVQFDSIFAEHMDNATLGRYKALILSDARDLEDKEAAAIEQWIRAGGTLLASGGLSLNLHAILPAAITGRVGGIADEDRVGLFVCRELKPPTGFVNAKATMASEFLRGAALFVYETQLGYRALTVKPGSDLLAKWDDGTPAVVGGEVGKGRVIYFGADYMGLVHTDVGFPVIHGRGWFPQWKDFYPGTREFLASLVRGGLKAAGGQELVTVANCPSEVEVKVLRQESRFIIHFTNYDEKAARVKGIEAEFACDPAEIERVHSPEDDREMRFEKTASGIQFEVPEFSLFHRAVVVEMKPRGNQVP